MLGRPYRSSETSLPVAAGVLLIMSLALILRLVWRSSAERPVHAEIDALPQAAVDRVLKNVVPVFRSEASPEESVAEANRAVLLRVLGPNDEPVAGALVTGLAEAKGNLIGSTSSDGGVLLTPKEFGSEGLAIMAEGFISTEVAIAPPFPDQVDVHLARGAAISGFVLDTEGLPAREGMTVMAVSPLYYFDDRALGLTLSGSPLIPLTYTDTNGQFMLSGLNPDLHYRLFAAGHGLVAFDEKLTAMPGTVDVELTARPVYGVLVCPRDEFGNPPKAARLEGQLDSATSEAQHAHILHASKWTPRLLGVDRVTEAQAPYYDRYLFFTTERDLGDSIPIRYRLRIPGYEPVDAELNALRLADRVPVQQQLVKRTCAGFGKVTVVVTPPSRVDALLRAVSSGRECRLLLREIVMGHRFEARLKDLAPSGMELIDGVPYGDYAVTFVAPHSLFAYPDNNHAPVMVRIGPEPALLDVPISAFGTIELRILTADHHLYSGPVLGSHVRLDNSQMDVFYFSTPPYRIPLMPGAEYRMELDNLQTNLESKTLFVREDDSTTVVSWLLSR